jgi:hypothetical protein
VKTGLRFRAAMLAPALLAAQASRPLEARAAGRTETHEGVAWRFSESERAAFQRLRPLLDRFLSRPSRRPLPLAVSVFSGVSAMARADGDCRFATLARRGGEVEVHVAADAPENPDLVSPVFASAVFLALHPEAVRRPGLLAGYGAYRAGAWWGRGTAEWGPLLAAAGLLPTAEELAAAGEPDASDLLFVGGAAAVVAAWAQEAGRSAVERALASGEAPAEDLRRGRSSAASLPAAAPPRRLLPPGFLRGISFAMSNSMEGSYLSPRCGATLDRLKRDWIGAISVMPFAFQRRADSPAISLPRHEPREETEEAVLAAARAGHARGLAVLVKPQIWLWRGFTGDIGMKDEADWKAWFRGYRRFVLRHAVVAEAAGAELFDVGVELCATEKRERDWRGLIALVRLATGAPLIYSCNWGRGAASVPFWDALDAVGVDFYDPLSSDARASDRELAQGALAAARPLAEASSRFARPVYLTEVGFPPVAAAWISPSDEDARRPFFPEDAARSARAVFEAIGGASWCRGFFWWKAFSDGGESRGEEKSFNVVGMPIERVIRDGYRRIASLRPSGGGVN